MRNPERFELEVKHAVYDYLIKNDMAGNFEKEYIQCKHICKIKLNRLKDLGL